MPTNTSSADGGYTTTRHLINTITTIIEDYLNKGKEGTKADNARTAQRSVFDLDSTESLEIILNKISQILDDWEKNNNALIASYWISERLPEKFANPSQTPIVIAECRAELEEFSKLNLTKNDVANDVIRIPVLHAFPNHINMSIEDKLFSMLNTQDFLGFEQLIQQNPQGYNVNAKDQNGKTLLHHASINADILFLTLLLQEGADPKIGDEKKGWTPVHYAAFAGKDAYMTLFLENNRMPVDWTLLTHAGETIYQVAMDGKEDQELPQANAKHDEVIQILNNLGLNLSSSQLASTVLFKKPQLS